MKSRRSRDRQGLTLMEIMLVLVILGILGSMAAMFITTAREDALKKATKIEIDNLSTACEQYSMAMFNYPQQLQDLMEQPSSDSTNRWAGPYLKPNNDLKDPWLNDYQYEQTTVAGNKSSFTISSAGPDGSIGSEDDVTSNDQF
jgi:general secretion pathway protein G